MNFEKALQENYAKWKNRDYFFEKKNGVYEAITYGDFLDKTRRFATCLLSKDYAGKNILLYGKNSINWMIADLAVLHYVGACASVSKEWKYEDIHCAIGQLDIPCVIYGSEQAEVIAQIRVDFPEIEYIPLDALEDYIAGITLEEAEAKCIPQDENKCCKIVFSSGTTSKPKVVMLSRKNMFAGYPALLRRCPFDETDVNYLFLPLSHTYGGILNFLYGLVAGFSIYLCSSVNDMAQEILEVNPTIFSAVPVVCRRFYDGYGAHIGKAFGNRIKYLFCGAAHFDREIRRAYIDSGLNIMTAFGLSETAASGSIQYPFDTDDTSDGTVAEEIKVKILDPDEKGIGEIAIKGDLVFLGYAGDEELTRSLFTEDGFFRTGDTGYLLPDELHGGFRLYHTGRIKKILLGENGENIEPTHIEEKICSQNANINKALVYMTDNTLSCNLYLKEAEDRDWDAFFKAINDELPSYEKIRKYDVSLDSVEKRMKQ